MRLISADWVLESVLILLLAATLFHAVRLERALGVLKRDRSAIDKLIAGFNASTQQAEMGIDKLRAMADGVGNQLVRQIENAQHVHSDLEFLTARGERVADRIDSFFRSGRLISEASREPEPPPLPRLRSQAERDLLKALKLSQ